MSAKLKVKRGTTDSWADTSKDTTLDAGQLGVEYRDGNTPRIKVGPDVRDDSGNTVPQAWSNIDYLAPDTNVFFNQPVLSTAMIYPNGRVKKYNDSIIGLDYIFDNVGFYSNQGSNATIGIKSSPWRTVYASNLSMCSQINATDSTSTIAFNAGSIEPLSNGSSKLGSESKKWESVYAYTYYLRNPADGSESTYIQAFVNDVTGEQHIGATIRSIAPDPAAGFFNPTSVSLIANARWHSLEGTLKNYDAKLVVESINTRSHVYGEGAYGFIDLGTDEKPWETTYTNTIKSVKPLIAGSTANYPVMTITAGTDGATSTTAITSAYTSIDLISQYYYDSTSASAAITSRGLRWGYYSSEQLTLTPTVSNSTSTSLGTRTTPWTRLWLGNASGSGYVYFVNNSGSTVGTIQSLSGSNLTISTTMPSTQATGTNLILQVAGNISGSARTASLTIQAPVNVLTTGYASIVPDVDQAFLLGSSGKRFAYVHSMGYYGNSLTSYSTSITFGTTAGGIGRFYGSGTTLYFAPYTNSTSSTTGINLGTSSYKWRYVYCYGGIYINGTLTSSDRSLKTDIRYLSDMDSTSSHVDSDITTQEVVDFVRNLKPCVFAYKDDSIENQSIDNSPTGISHIGFIAQDMNESKLWRYIGTEFDYDTIIEPAEFDEEGNEIKEAVIETDKKLALKPLSVATTALTMCKYLLEKIEALETKIQELESK